MLSLPVNKPYPMVKKRARHKTAFEDMFGVAGKRDWKPQQTLFVLWYHLTTTLPHEKIAECFNRTFPDSEEMLVWDVNDIVHTLLGRSTALKVTWIKEGRAPKPIAAGWHPCDHGIRCGANAQEKHKSVKRNRRTRKDQECAELAEQIWDASWQHLLQCPRSHLVKPATCLGTRPRITRKGAIAAGTAPLSLEYRFAAELLLAIAWLPRSLSGSPSSISTIVRSQMNIGPRSISKS